MREVCRGIGDCLGILLLRLGPSQDRVCLRLGLPRAYIAVASQPDRLHAWQLIAYKPCIEPEDISLYRHSIEQTQTLILLLLSFYCYQSVNYCFHDQVPYLQISRSLAKQCHMHRILILHSANSKLSPNAIKICLSKKIYISILFLTFVTLTQKWNRIDNLQTQRCLPEVCWLSENHSCSIHSHPILCKSF